MRRKDGRRVARRPSGMVKRPLPFSDRTGLGSSSGSRCHEPQERPGLWGLRSLAGPGEGRPAGACATRLSRTSRRSPCLATTKGGWGDLLRRVRGPREAVPCAGCMQLSWICHCRTSWQCGRAVSAATICHEDERYLNGNPGQETPEIPYSAALRCGLRAMTSLRKRPV
jgi:hypothetical protein